MDNFVFSCSSVNGLTLNEKREAIKALRASVAAELVNRKFHKAHEAEVKAIAAQARIDAAIAKAQAKLEKALARTVKAPAQKKRAARKAGPVTVTYGAEANVIAESLKAKRVQKELF
jgi:hypothetical protein